MYMETDIVIILTDFLSELCRTDKKSHLFTFQLDGGN